MKKKILISLLLVVSLVLSGCGSGVTTSPEASTESGQEASVEPSSDSGGDIVESSMLSEESIRAQDESSPLAEHTGSIANIAGNYTPITSAFADRLASADTMGGFYMGNAVEVADRLVVVWYDTETTPSKSYVELIDLQTGESLGSLAYEDMIQGLRKTNEASGNYRLSFADRIEYLSSTDPSDVRIIPLPAPLVGKIWTDDVDSAIPLDADPDTGLMAISTASGILLTDLEGEEADTMHGLVLNNADLPAVMAGVEMPEHDDSQLHYIAPVLLDGGDWLVATIYMTGDSTGDRGGYDGCPYGITAANLRTGETIHLPDVMPWIAGSATWLDESRVAFLSNNGYTVFTPTINEVTETAFDFHTASSWDFKTIVQPVQTEDTWTLVTFSADNPAQEYVRLTAAAERLLVHTVTEKYVLCTAYMPDGTQHMLIVPYTV